MESGLKKKYGLPMAIAMVVGIVIGSGVFFKAEIVLAKTGGDVPMGILAWALVGLIMLICAYTFATMATKYEHVNGIVDYAEVMCGRSYGYYMGWFMAVIYQPTIASVLAWVSARYTCVLLGWDITGGSCMVIAGFFLIASYGLNALSPILAGKFQVSTTFLKLIPLLLMGVVGTIVGLSNGTTVENFTRAAETTGGQTGLFVAVVAVAFAYEGWIIATSINSEIVDSKKNLPRALVWGSLIIIAVYILYYIGLAGAVSTETLMAGGESGAKMAFQNLFGSVGGSLIFVFVIISCLGTLNGVMVGSTRGLYALAARNEGPRPDMLSQIDKVTNMPTNSAVWGLLFCGFWLLYFYGANLTATWFGPFSFDTSELPIITLYAGYIPIFIMLMIKGKDFSPFRRYVMPALSILSCVFMSFSAVQAHGQVVVYYLIVFAVIMGAGALLRGKRKTPQSLS